MSTNTPIAFRYTLYALLTLLSTSGCGDKQASASRLDSLETDVPRDSGMEQEHADAADASQSMVPEILEAEEDAGAPGSGMADDFDAGVDGCGGCPPSAPLCDRVARECHACSQDSECSEAELGARCLDGACVECERTADCTGSTASVCDLSAHVCVGCFDNDDCDHIRIGERALGVCGDDRQCVECTGLQREACGTADDGVTQLSCHSLLRSCTTKRVHDESVCGACVSDVECAEGMRCVKESFGSEALGYVCQWTVDGEDSRLSSCSAPEARPYNLRRDDVRTIDGAVVSICALTHSTCSAVRQFATTACSVGHDESCGEPGFDDALCRPRDPKDDDPLYRCTLPCTVSDDCPRGHACNQELPLQYCELRADTCFASGDCAAGETCEEGHCVLQ